MMLIISGKEMERSTIIGASLPFYVSDDSILYTSNTFTAITSSRHFYLNETRNPVPTRPPRHHPLPQSRSRRLLGHTATRFVEPRNVGVHVLVSHRRSTP